MTTLASTDPTDEVSDGDGALPRDRSPDDRPSATVQETPTPTHAPAPFGGVRTTAVSRLIVRRRGLVLLASLALLICSAVLGGQVFGALTTGGFLDPASESSEAKELLEEVFDERPSNLVLVVTATEGTVDDAGVEAAATTFTNQFLQPGGADAARIDAVSYWSLGRPEALRSTDSRRAVVAMRVTAEDEDLVHDATERIEDAAKDLPTGSITVQPAGIAAVDIAVTKQVERDLVRAELIAVPILVVLLVLVFGGLLAAGLPLAVGLVSVAGTLLTLWVTSRFTDVSVFSINLTTAMGLGLGIDYSLFVVTRFREELAKRDRSREAVEAAVAITLRTAGRTVVYSALTVAVSLTALLLFPLYFLRSFAYAGIGVVLIAAAASVISLPALLVLLGHRVAERRRFLHRNRAHAHEGFWHRTAMWVMRRPIPIVVVVGALLVAAGVPFIHAEFGTPDDRVLPIGHPVREAADILRSEFPTNETDAFAIVAPDANPLDTAALDAYAGAVSAIPGVARVDAFSGRFIGGTKVAVADGTDPSLLRFARSDTPGTWLSVVPSIEPISAEGERLIDAVRALDAGNSMGRTLVGGVSAELVDTKAAIADRLPAAGAWIAVTTLVLLFLMTGSVIVPLKAIVINLLSLTATFGAMVWIFQDGNGSDLLNFTPTGTLDVTTPILMFCIAFGLSMDYEVFLLSRIKECYDRTKDNVASVALGLEQTGRLVTAAAALLAVTFLAFATSGITFIKLFGLGLAIAVIMDAAIVRSLLVPALMRLAGDLNWWAPSPMRRFHQKYGLHEVHEPDEVAAAVPSTRPGDVVPVRAFAPQADLDIADRRPDGLEELHHDAVRADDEPTEPALDATVARNLDHDLADAAADHRDVTDLHAADLDHDRVLAENTIRDDRSDLDDSADLDDRMDLDDAEVDDADLHDPDLDDAELDDADLDGEMVDEAVEVDEEDVPAEPATTEGVADPVDELVLASIDVPSAELPQPVLAQAVDAALEQSVRELDGRVTDLDDRVSVLEQRFEAHLAAPPVEWVLTPRRVGPGAWVRTVSQRIDQRGAAPAEGPPSAADSTERAESVSVDTGTSPLTGQPAASGDTTDAVVADQAAATVTVSAEDAWFLEALSRALLPPDDQPVTGA